MPRLIWNYVDYGRGVSHGVFYPPNGIGEAWDGLISVEESPDEGFSRITYRDGVKVTNGRRDGDFNGTIEAYTYPSSFYDGVVSTARRRGTFGFSYRTKTALGEKIHFVYNAIAVMRQRTYEQEEATPFTWDFTTKPVPVPGAKPSAHIIIDASKTNTVTLQAIEDLIYGSATNSPTLPLPQALWNLFEANIVLTVTDHGDGTFTVTGPDDAIVMTSPTSFEITWPTAVYIDEDTYTIRSL